MYSFGIVLIIVSAIGNIFYYICSYFCYQHFDEIAMDKLGTKLVYHQMFKWNQFQHSTVKVDCGIVGAFVATCLCFGIHNVLFPIIDGLFIAFAITNIFMMKYYLRYENKAGVLIFLVLRILFEGYMVFRTGDIINNVTGGEKNVDFFSKGYGKPVTITMVIVDGIVLIGVIITSIKCITNFGKGLRDMINKQTNDITTNENSVDTEESV
jgi:hypothetical protein